MSFLSRLRVSEWRQLIFVHSFYWSADTRGDPRQTPSANKLGSDYIVDRWGERVLLPEIEAIGALTPHAGDVPSVPVVEHHTEVTGSFQPRQLTLARERRGLAKAQLAVLCRVDLETVTEWEIERIAEPLVDTVARQLGVSERFFFGQGDGTLVSAGASYHAFTNTSARRTVPNVALSASIRNFWRAFSGWRARMATR